MRALPGMILLPPLLFSLFSQPRLFSSVLINEIMKDPAAVPDTRGEWFEIHNTGGEAVDLGGWVIRDLGSDQHRIRENGNLIVPPGGYVVLGRNGDPSVNGGYSPDYVYDGIILSNGEDEILLYDGTGALIDSVAYHEATWPSDPGASMEFIEDGADNGVGENWLSSTEPFGDGDMGTPGEQNSAGSVGIGEGSTERGREAGPRRAAIQNYPNPFRGWTTIRLEVVSSPTGEVEQGARSGSAVTLRVYDLHGRRVRDLWEGVPANGSEIVWDGKDDNGVDLPPGAYIIRMTGWGLTVHRKVLLEGNY